jgi:hypothetical protein
MSSPQQTRVPPPALVTVTSLPQILQRYFSPTSLTAILSSFTEYSLGEPHALLPLYWSGRHQWRAVDTFRIPTDESPSFFLSSSSLNPTITSLSKQMVGTASDLHFFIISSLAALSSTVLNC